MKRYYLIGVLLFVFGLNMPEFRDFWHIQIQLAGTYQQSIWSNRESYINAFVGEPAKTITVDNKTVNIDTKDDFSLSHGQSMTGAQIDTVLKSLNSPTYGKGNFAVEMGQKYNIDAAYWLAMYIQESSAGTNPNWAGYIDANTSTYNTGNIICTSDEQRCMGRFIWFNSWEEGIEAHFKLLAYYRDSLGKKDIDSAINTWAPSEDNNDPSSYANQVKTKVRDWRNVNKQDVVKVAEVKQDGKISPVTRTMKINAHYDSTDCYYWGSQPGCQHLGTDYALEDNEQVFAPVGGFVITVNAYPEDDPFFRKGAYIMYKTYDGYELYFGHLKDIPAYKAGDIIKAGDVLGKGRADLLHTHVQLRNPDGSLGNFETYYNERKSE